VLGIVKHPGVFREFFTLPESNLHEVPAHIPDDEAVFAEPVAAACEILDQVHIPHNTPVAVLGDGKLGLLAAQVLEAHGARVYLYGKHAEKMALAQRAGIDVRPTDAAPPSAYRFTVEATGTAAGLSQAVRMTRPRGTVIMKSTVHNAVKIDTAPIVVNEITLVGSRCGRFQPALDMLGSGMLHVREMISARYPLAEAPAAFRRAASKGVLKVLLENQ
jgi:alcohol dehydrogenase